MSVQHVNRRASVSHRLGRFARDGTVDIIAGSAVAGLGAYVYQVWGARLLGAADFAPLSQLLTVHYLAFAVVLLPVEQVVIRRLALNPGDSPVHAVAKWAIGALSLLAAAFVLVFEDRLFGGSRAFAVVAAATVLSHALFAIGRGHLAGRGRYRAYGMVSAAAVLFRLLVVGAVVAAGTTSVGLAWALVVGPVVIVAWRPFAKVVWDGPPPGEDRSGQLLAGLVVAAAAAQTLLLSGTVVSGLLAEESVVPSLVFATFTLFRAPLVLGNNLLARVLPPFTAMAVSGEYHRLARWARGLSLAGIAAAGAAAGGGALLGPFVIELFFGEDFVVTSLFAAVVAAGVVLSGTGTFLNQILLARGATAGLAASWLIALVAGGLALLLPVDDVAERVGIAFLIGSVTAMMSLVLGAVRHAGKPPGSPG